MYSWFIRVVPRYLHCSTHSQDLFCIYLFLCSQCDSSYFSLYLCHTDCFSAPACAKPVLKPCYIRKASLNALFSLCDFLYSFESSANQNHLLLCSQSLFLDPLSFPSFLFFMHVFHISFLWDYLPDFSALNILSSVATPPPFFQYPSSSVLLWFIFPRFDIWKVSQIS